MPFKSEAQRRWMYATHPRMAKRWQKETKSKDLPERVKEASLAAFFDELEKMSAMGVDLRVKGDGGVRRPLSPRRVASRLLPTSSTSPEEWRS